MSDRLVIVGAGGHGREALGVARAANRAGNRWDDIVFVDDGLARDPLRGEGTTLLGRLQAVCVGPVEQVMGTGDEYVIAIGDPAARKRVADHIGDTARSTTLVDPTARLGDDVTVSAGVMIFPGAICTTNVRIGAHSHLNCGVVVSHDCRIGETVSLSPGVLLSGAVTVEDGAFVGSGAVVLPGLTVGQGAVVGAGAVVTDDVAPATTVVGVPARPVG